MGKYLIVEEERKNNLENHPNLRKRYCSMAQSRLVGTEGRITGMWRRKPFTWFRGYQG